MLVGLTPETVRVAVSHSLQHSSEFSPATPDYSENYDDWHESGEGEKKGLAIASLVLRDTQFSDV